MLALAGANENGTSFFGGTLFSSIPGFSAGNGGSGTATATANGTGTHDTFGITASAIAAGQQGGNVFDQTNIGNGGNGGPATATATATGVGTNIVEANTQASGGDGGAGSGTSAQHSGNGGNAVANSTATSTNSAGQAQASATAYGGSYIAPLGSAAAGATGTAIANATATGALFSYATALGNGSSGTLTAVAKSGPSSDGQIAFVQSTSVSSTDIPVGARSESRGLVGQTAPTFSTATGDSAAAFLTASPLSSDVSSLWIGNVQTAFGNNPANVSALGLANLQDLPGGPSTSQTYSTVQDLNLDSAHLNGNNLVVGMLGATPGLQSGDTLRFRIERAGTALIDQTFTTNTAISTFLNNTLFDLGHGTDNAAPGNPDIQILFDLTTTPPGAGVGAEFVFGSIPLTNPSFANAAGGSWTNPTNWQNNTLPNGPNAQAIPFSNQRRDDNTRSKHHRRPARAH